MVKQTQGDSLASCIKAPSKLFVLTAWHRVATGMIVGKNKIGSTSEQCLTKNQAYVYGRLCYASSADNMMSHKLILDIEQQHMTFLMTEVTHSDGEILVDIGRTRETMTRTLTFEHQTLAQLQSSLYCNSLGWPYAVVVLEFVAC